MKKIFLATIIIINSFVSVSSFAQSSISLGKTDISIQPEENTNNFWVSVDKMGKDVIDVKIYNTEGMLLKQDAFEKEGSFKKRFLMQDIKNQDISVVFSNSTQEISQKVHLHENEVVINVEEKKQEFKPTLRQKDGNVLVQWQLPSEKNLKVTLISATNETLYMEEVLKGQDTFVRTYNIEQLPSGKYIMLLSSNDKSYQLSFNKANSNYNDMMATR